MISIEEVKQDLGGNLTDEQAEGIRNSIYKLVETLLDDYIEKSWKNVGNEAENTDVDENDRISNISRL